MSMFLNDLDDVWIKDRVTRVEYCMDRSASTRRHSAVDRMRTQAHGDGEMTDPRLRRSFELDFQIFLGVSRIILGG
jgi:hypothetical protein